jgi:hypothetical protein
MLPATQYGHGEVFMGAVLTPSPTCVNFLLVVVVDHVIVVFGIVSLCFNASLIVVISHLHML